MNSPVRSNNPETAPKAVCLFSGGLDSTTVLYLALADGFHVTALTVNYGQVHAREIQAAAAILKPLGVEHNIVEVPMPWGGSALTDRKIAIPRSPDGYVDSASIPSTYVPARNLIFLSLAASLAEARGADTLFIGANAIDYSGYPDCRPEFLNSFEETVNLGTKAGTQGSSFKVRAPLVRLSKKATILLGVSLGVPYEKTWSCYAGEETPCGTCDSCILRKNGFREAGLPDPAISHAISANL